eukprot:6235833-Amphidinium_carterae.1
MPGPLLFSGISDSHQVTTPMTVEWYKVPKAYLSHDSLAVTIVVVKVVACRSRESAAPCPAQSKGCSDGNDSRESPTWQIHQHSHVVRCGGMASDSKSPSQRFIQEQARSAIMSRCATACGRLIETNYGFGKQGFGSGSSAVHPTQLWQWCNECIQRLRRWSLERRPSLEVVLALSFLLSVWKAPHSTLQTRCIATANFPSPCRLGGLAETFGSELLLLLVASEHLLMGLLQACAQPQTSALKPNYRALCRKL